jgi:hypothetical protein
MLSVLLMLQGELSTLLLIDQALSLLFRLIQQMLEIDIELRPCIVWRSHLAPVGRICAKTVAHVLPFKPCHMLFTGTMAAGS